jgi:hypothetical protein
MNVRSCRFEQTAIIAYLSATMRWQVYCTCTHTVLCCTYVCMYSICTYFFPHLQQTLENGFEGIQAYFNAPGRPHAPSPLITSLHLHMYVCKCIYIRTMYPVKSTIRSPSRDITSRSINSGSWLGPTTRIECRTAGRESRQCVCGLRRRSMLDEYLLCCLC